MTKMLIAIACLFGACEALADDIPKRDQIYLCYDGITLKGARDAPNAKCPGPAVNQKTNAEWLAFRDRKPTQAEIDAQYGKFYCNQEGLRELIMEIAALKDETPAETCTSMKGNRP